MEALSEAIIASIMAYLEPGNLRRGPWLEEEDERLNAFVTLLGERKWDSIAKAAGLKRSGKSCRLRWLNYLRPNLKRGQISPEEKQIILQLHQQWGNKWSRIARMLPGRTDNEIKNYWRTHLRKKQAEQKGEIHCVMSNSRQENPCQKTAPSAWKNKIEESVDSTAEMSADSSDLSSYIHLNSPYEIRLQNWVSELSGEDQDQYKAHGDWNGLDRSSWMAWNSDDNYDIRFDSMETLWNMS